MLWFLKEERETVRSHSDGVGEGGGTYSVACEPPPEGTAGATLSSQKNQEKSWGVLRRLPSRQVFPRAQ